MHFAVLDPGRQMEYIEYTGDKTDCYDIAIEYIRNYNESVNSNSSTYVQILMDKDVSGNDVAIFIDEEGRLKQLPVNRYYITRQGYKYLLAGRVVLMCFVNNEGDLVLKNMSKSIFSSINSLNGGDGTADYHRATQEESDTIDEPMVYSFDNLEDAPDFIKKLFGL